MRPEQFPGEPFFQNAEWTMRQFKLKFGNATSNGIRWGSLLLTLVCAFGGLIIQTAQAEIVITLTDGKQIVVDQIGPEASEKAVGVRVVRPGISLTRWISWNRIRSATVARQTFTPADLQRLVRDNSELLTKSAVTSPASKERTDNQILQAGFQRPAPYEDDPRPEDAPRPVPPQPIPPQPTPAQKVRPAHVVPMLPQFPVWVGRIMTPGPCGYTMQEDVLPPGHGVVVGVQDDPLSAYPDLERSFYPFGIPLSERGFARDIFRAARAQAMLGQPCCLLPGGAGVMPGNVVPGPIVPRRTTGSSEVRITGIRAVAAAMNANGRADCDALQLDLAAVTAGGLIVPIASNASLQVSLWGREQRVVRAYGRSFFGDPGRIEQVANWSPTMGTTVAGATTSNGGRVVTVSRQPNVARFILPLSNPLPDQDARRFAYADLHVELTVPGQGNFETSVAGVSLRPGNALRDRESQEAGSRFFPDELLSGNRQITGPLFGFDSALGPDSTVLSVQP